MSAARVPRGLLRLLAGLALVYLPVTLPLALLPVFVHSRLGGGGASIGVVIGAEAITAMLVRPLAGIAFARFGPRRVFVVGAVLVAAGSLPNAVASAFVPLVLLRLLVGVGVGAVLATRRWCGRRSGAECDSHCGPGSASRARSAATRRW